ncbi:hypothetical protein COW36_24630 [bacterium (Candidatus Blackallbacteria) CG17_big_fil_post_rev_8_21_14_2_50_48_46]|uniref:RmlD-like substrate binding domain-containing protein n=1 Tax=bacterium (Candidatus Blackallbacteria) CG17_big_fil_post_rev_8_21_14_2_50_48_46 TaxID=2014261 RepID=A0A2M7FXI4_9BACT|nr:MAG: hypothetical protein COW64_19570 [bacterium (Candidatus Blackallbacteria) CG18_big_fil_WC_8_21_14_2_50_49_26]PIW13855.1 MAG: hypothetical protein COW36_24630 [bacterium (Candidatus Blackallbacteria) CG17_big_fil_post_rev_8_21_14_2_50_48_46]PIW45081.1 MAG: hypothetical protein COW20_22260 [bacterium (Candidatus Blackallbacteria) CG13_big_fil_rev_8_21_14_2_50_49_14]
MYERILITGASGGLGGVLFQSLKERYTVLGTCFQHPGSELTVLDLRDISATLSLCERFQPDLIINTVAWTDVDGCERDYRVAFEKNVQTALAVRLATEACEAKLIHISTNDIFSGAQGHYSESDLPEPINHYSRTKYLAEQVVQDLPRALILRFTFLSWWATGKTSFARWLVESLQRGKEVRLFQDQFNAPLYVGTLLEWLEQLWTLEGVYHLASERRSRWDAGMALAQALNLNTDLILPGSFKTSDLPAPRPADVSLSAEKLLRETGLKTSLAQEIAKMVRAVPEDLRTSG